MIGGSGWRDLAGLPRATFDALFADGPDVIVAGAINPTGSIERVDDGYRVTGRWAFASGCEHADWLFADCVEGIVDGVPKLRMALLTPDEVVIEDTWHVSGLRGTGSHHFHVDGVVVPPERTFLLDGGRRASTCPLSGSRRRRCTACCLASVALGIAQGALDDIVEPRHAQGAAPRRGTARHQPVLPVRSRDGGRRAPRRTRAGLRDRGASVWAAASTAPSRRWSRRHGFGPARCGQRTAPSASSTRPTAAAAAARSTPAVRCSVASATSTRVTQHFLVRRDTMTTAGAILAGNEVHVLLF